MPTLVDIEHNIRDLSTKALAVTDDVSRPWSERAPEVERMESDIKSLTDQHAALKAEIDRHARLQEGAKFGASQAATDQPVDQSVQTKSIGDQIAESLKNSNGARGVRFSVATDVKSATDGATLKANLTEAAGGAGAMIPQYLPGLTEILFRRLTIADLLPTGTANGASIIYLKESSVTNAAAAVAESGLKPASDLNVTTVTENWHKVATTLKVSDEMLTDYAYTASYVNGRLVIFVRLGEEDQLLNGSGSGANMTGLLNRSGKQTAQAVGTDTGVDAIYKQITNIRKNAFVEPDGIVISPSNWQTLRLAKDANGQYYAGGPFTGAYGNGGVPAVDMLWGKPVVVTPAIADGTALVGSFQTCAQRFVQGCLRVETTNANEDDFLHNLVAFRAEIREILAVYRPGGFGTVTGLV